MNWRKWLDGFVLAAKGILLATKEKRFWYGFIPSFIFFGMLMNLLNAGLAKFELIRVLGFPKGLRIIGESFLAIFGINQSFFDWLPIFFVTLPLFEDSHILCHANASLTTVTCDLLVE